MSTTTALFLSLSILTLALGVIATSALVVTLGAAALGINVGVLIWELTATETLSETA